MIHNQKKWRKEVQGRIEMPSYDSLAIREAIVNALIHRQYTRVGTEVSIDIFDDRIEISSPGEMSSGDRLPTNITTIIKSERRNPILADLFLRMGYMERRGSDLKKITKKTNLLFNDNDNHVEYFCEHGFFTVRIYNANYKTTKNSKNEPQKLTEAEQKLKKIIEEDKNISKQEMANKLGKSMSYI